MRILSVAIVLSVVLWPFIISPAPAVSAMPVAILSANNDQPMNLGALAKRPITDEKHTAQPQTEESRFPAAIQIDNTVEGILHFLAKRLDETDVKLPPKPKHPPKCGFYTRGCPPQGEDSKAERALGIEEREPEVWNDIENHHPDEDRDGARAPRKFAGNASRTFRSDHDDGKETEIKGAIGHGNEPDQYHAARASFEGGERASELGTKADSAEGGPGEVLTSVLSM